MSNTMSSLRSTPKKQVLFGDLKAGEVFRLANGSGAAKEGYLYVKSGLERAFCLTHLSDSDMDRTMEVIRVRLTAEDE